MSYLIRILNSSIFWAAWMIIPFLMEFIPAIKSLFILQKRKKQNRNRKKIKFLPNITIIIPVYNSEKTLFNCIKSINDSTYSNEFIKILLVNNKPGSNDFNIFCQAQNAFPSLRMQWLESKQGKSKALNMALYNSEGKYIFNVDSDGIFEKNAIMNMIEKFEGNNSINCMTGTILTEPALIEKEKGFFHKLLCKLEFMEYAQAFLAGRSYSAENNEIYTLSGAFSAFRKNAILSSRMYNTDTICEDTQMTFQMKYLYENNIEICEDAVFYVDPIESINKLYTQRQRWQRGSLEVSKMFNNKFKITKAFSDENVRTILYDHTFSFPRIIWYIVTLYFILMNYSRQILVFSTILIYLMYVLISFAYFLNAQTYLKDIPDTKKYYWKNICLISILPIFNFIIFFFRMAGIVNSINTDSAWKTRDFNDEKEAIKKIIRKDFNINER